MSEQTEENIDQTSAKKGKNHATMKTKVDSAAKTEKVSTAKTAKESTAKTEKEQSAIQPLNLPPIKPKLRIYRGKEQIWDSQRHQFVALTPEEWVRQHFVSFLVNCRSYSHTLMANEVCIKLNGMSRRCDSVLYSPDLTPRMIIEYKRPNVKISKNVFAQICRYNLVMHVDYLIVSNGIEHYCCKMDYDQNSYNFLTDIPEYGDL